MNYLKIYNEICDRAKNDILVRSENRKNKTQYYESHHIIPRCMGGTGKCSEWEHTNIVLLTAKEHFICHRLLCLIYPENLKLQHALWWMATRKSKGQIRHTPSAKVYSTIKENYIKTVLGKAKTLEHRTKIGIANKGRIVSAETRIKQSLIRKGKQTLLGNRSKQNKGKSLEDIYGVDKANEIRYKAGSHRRNKTYEEIYGVENAEIMKQKVGEAVSKFRSGKTYEELYGVEKAQLLRLKKSNQQLKQKHMCVHCGKESNPANISRWHNDNCKLKTEVVITNEINNN